jgi:hypothetical protein
VRDESRRAARSAQADQTPRASRAAQAKPPAHPRAAATSGDTAHPAGTHATAATRGKKAAADKSAPALDTDVALISAIIMHADGRGSPRAPVDGCEGGDKKCAAKPSQP